jgi:hypothetical protein
MRPELRAAIAAIAKSRSTGAINGVYDYSRSTHVAMSGSANESNINAYCYDGGFHVSGSSGNLYDYGNGNHITIKFDGNNFSGYDYGSGSHYSGSINGLNISIFDYEFSKHYSYS